MNYFSLKICLPNLIGTVNQTDNKEINKCFVYTNVVRNCLKRMLTKNESLT